MKLLLEWVRDPLSIPDEDAPSVSTGRQLSGMTGRLRLVSESSNRSGATLFRFFQPVKGISALDPGAAPVRA